VCAILFISDARLIRGSASFSTFLCMVDQVLSLAAMPRETSSKSVRV